MTPITKICDDPFPLLADKLKWNIHLEIEIQIRNSKTRFDTFEKYRISIWNLKSKSEIQKRSLRSLTVVSLPAPITPITKVCDDPLFFEFEFKITVHIQKLADMKRL